MQYISERVPNKSIENKKSFAEVFLTFHRRSEPDHFEVDYPWGRVEQQRLLLFSSENEQLKTFFSHLLMLKFHFLELYLYLLSFQLIFR